MVENKINLSRRSKNRGLLFLLFIGIFLFIWQLGSTGLFDETPPLFAAAGRAMHITGDWLTPKVNGFNRFDKPPLFYWLMGLLYALPGQDYWDPLGTWSARLPSAFSSLLMMLLIGETLMSSPQKFDSFPRRTAVIGSLAFALSPLVIIWSRIAVSDALLCSTLGISLLFQWRRYSNTRNHPWWLAWLVLSLSVLTKGPVAIVLMFMVLMLFGFVQSDFYELIRRLKPIKGFLLTLLISSPWYLIELIKEGKPFWDSFFGYHNFQRLTSVVNDHQAPWWFFGLILIISSLPFTPYLILALYKESLNIFSKNNNHLRSESLSSFAFCWLLSVLLLFTLAATKLPSYWLPATPAAAILVGIFSSKIELKYQNLSFPFICTFIISILFSLLLFSLPIWVELINDPEMPNLASELVASKIYLNGALLIFFLSCIGVLFSYKIRGGKLILLQVPFILFNLIILHPILNLGDKLRQLPLREASELIINSKKINEPIAMVGIKKPSLHFYTNSLVIYEWNDKVALVNLAERLRLEKRYYNKSYTGESAKSSNKFLLVIDNQTSNHSHWRNLNPELLGQFSIYKVWRLNKSSLQKRAEELISDGVQPDWQDPNPEKF